MNGINKNCLKETFEIMKKSSCLFTKGQKIISINGVAPNINLVLNFSFQWFFVMPFRSFHKFFLKFKLFHDLYKQLPSYQIKEPWVLLLEDFSWIVVCWKLPRSSEDSVSFLSSEVTLRPDVKELVLDSMQFQVSLMSKYKGGGHPVIYAPLFIHVC